MHEIYRNNPEFEMNSGFMSDKAMLEFISNRPIVNSDTFFFVKNEDIAYFPVRKAEPAEGIWFVGGGRRAGESALDTLKRRLSKEACFNALEDDSIVELLTVECIWDYRKEEPKDHGRHDINTIFVTYVDEHDITSIAENLDPVEYDVSKGLVPIRSEDDLVEYSARQPVIDAYRRLKEIHED